MSMRRLTLGLLVLHASVLALAACGEPCVDDGFKGGACPVRVSESSDGETSSTSIGPPTTAEDTTEGETTQGTDGACESNTDCEEPTPVCEPATGECVPCTPTDDPC